MKGIKKMKEMNEWFKSSMYVTSITYMVLRSSCSSASLRWRTSFRVLMSSVTVPSSPANSFVKLLCSSSSGSKSAEFTFFFGVTAVKRVKALVSLNRVPAEGLWRSEDPEEKELQLPFQVWAEFRSVLFVIKDDLIKTYAYSRNSFIYVLPPYDSLRLIL